MAYGLRSLFLDLKKRLKARLDKSRKHSLVDVIDDSAFVQDTCKKRGISGMNGDVEELIWECVEDVRKLGLGVDQVYARIVDGIHILSSKEAVSKCVRLVSQDVISKAEEWELPWHKSTVDNVACGVIAMYILQCMKTSRQIIDC